MFCPLQVDTANQTVYFKLFNDCLQAGGDASYVERVTHLIMVASKMKGATCVGGLLPLVEGLPSGSDKMVKDITQQVRFYRSERSRKRGFLVFRQ